MAGCHFNIDKIWYQHPAEAPVPSGCMLVWIVLTGGGQIDYGWREPLYLTPGDVILVPAAVSDARLSVREHISLLEATVSAQ